MASDSSLPKYEPVVQRQPLSVGQDAYRVGYDQPESGGASGAQITVNMMMQQPHQQQQQMRTWSTSMCGCCEDMSSCCLLTFCSPCYASCSLAPRMGESCWAPFCLTLCGHSVPLVFRTKMRAAHGIAGGAIDDGCQATCCPLCVLCQVKREADYIERSTGRLAFPQL